MEEPASRKGKEGLRFPGGLANATVLKVESIALQVFCDCCVCVCTIGSFQNSKTFTVEEDGCFVLIFKRLLMLMCVVCEHRFSLMAVCSNCC